MLMAEDRALLEQAEAGDLKPVLRFYEWDVPTLSLGFHQSEERWICRAFPPQACPGCGGPPAARRSCTATN